MKCPLCEKELKPQFQIGHDPLTGSNVFFDACPTIIRLTRTCNDGRYIYDFSYDVSHYYLNDKTETAYVIPYRIHNYLDKMYCEVYVCPLNIESVCGDNSKKNNYVIFNSPIIPITTEFKLRERIKTLVLFS